MVYVICCKQMLKLQILIIHIQNKVEIKYTHIMNILVHIDCYHAIDQPLNPLCVHLLSPSEPPLCGTIQPPLCTTPTFNPLCVQPFSPFWNLLGPIKAGCSMLLVISISIILPFLCAFGDISSTRSPF